jgi:predicted dehydrogenase
MTTITRRTALAMTAFSYARVLGANDRVGLGLIGAGNRGLGVLSSFQKQAEVDVRAVCDVYGERVDRAQQRAPKAQGLRDHRKLLELKDVDAVLIATPDHWHQGTAIDALNAGKDVYVEKPLTRKPEEGPAIVRAARVNDRICQVGMQQRSGSLYLEARERFVRGGLLGKVSHVRCVWNSPPPGKLPADPATQPSNLDWARFLGPVKWRDWNPGQYLNFRAFLEFGGGKMTDFGAHWIDVAHMFLDVDAPLSVSATGGIFYPRGDDRNAPDTISALYRYPGFTLQFESLSVTAGGPPYGVEFYGEGGRLFINRQKYEWQRAGSGRRVTTPVETVASKVEPTIEHVRNFLDCCRSRKLPNGDVYIGHRSAQACLLAVQAYQESRTLRFDGEREEVLPL